MLHVGKSKIAACLAVYLSASFAATVINKNFWPFCSYNMFNDSFDNGVSSFSIHLQVNNSWSESLHPGNVYPVPFFRAVEVFERIFIRSNDEKSKIIFSKLLLDRINRYTWGARDEIYSSAQLSNPAKGIRIRVVERQKGSGEKVHEIFEYASENNDDDTEKS